MTTTPPTPEANRQPESAAGLAAPTGYALCACVHHDAYECARIRDGRHAKDEHEYHRRACECCCHKDEDNDDE
jgi:hypothetical protein